MDLQEFHRSLLASYPTPEQVRLYQAVPEMHGFSTNLTVKKLFVATFVTGLYLTRDWPSGTFREVHLIVTPSVENWAVETMNMVVQGIRKVRERIPKDQRADGNRMIVKSVTNLVMGSRPFSMPTEPARWVGFGFSEDSAAPDWLKAGLLPV